MAVAQLGNTSFTLRFTVRGGHEEREPVASGATVYVVVATDGSGKRPIPPLLLEALEPVV